MGNKKSAIIKTVVCVVIMAALIGGYYLYISNKDFRTKEQKQEEQAHITELLSTDLGKNYPENPREVLDYYSQLICCAYNEELTEEQFQALCVRIRALLDDELLEQNTQEQYAENMRKEIEEYKAEKKIITSYQVFKNSEVEYGEKDGDNFAILSAYYRLKSKKDSDIRTAEEFIMRQDSEKRWKILGWEVTGEKDADVEAE